MTRYSNLEAFTGKWSTSGRVFATATSSEIEIKGYDTYEWFSGGFFLIHKVDVLMGSDREESLEIISYDPATNTYPMHFFDNHGNSGVLEGRFKNDAWTFLSPSMRFTGTFSAEGNNLSGIWEQSTDGTNWDPWMEVILVRLEMRDNLSGLAL